MKFADNRIREVDAEVEVEVVSPYVSPPVGMVRGQELHMMKMKQEHLTDQTPD